MSGKWGAALIAAALGFSILTAPAVSLAAERTPLLMEGKKTLYQRVLSRPGAVLKRAAGDGPGAEQPAMTRFYVYSRKKIGDAEWLEVGLTDKGRIDGWMAADLSLPWKQQLTLAFTNPAGRERALMFRDKAGLSAVIEADNPDKIVSPLLKTVLAGKTDPRIVSIEPANYIDIAKKFYLLPILEAEETFNAEGHRVRVLKIASVTAEAGKEGALPPEEDKGKLSNFRAAIVFVVDSTTSMGPYIDRTKEAVRRVYDHIEKAGLLDRASFGLIAFRSNVEATPGIEYLTRLYVDPSTVKDGKDFLAKVQALKPTNVSTARFSEDSYAGVMKALNDISWRNFGGRYVILVTDAGALRGNDPLSSTKLDADQIRLEAQHRGVALYTLHLKTPSGKDNHAEAEAQYKVMSAHPLVPQPLYYDVPAGSVDRFGKIVDSLGDAIVGQVTAAYKGEESVGAASTADSKYESGLARDEATRIRHEAAMLGQAMRLAWLGSQKGTAAPPLFSAWISDRDLVRPDIATTEVRVLLTKNQLSDMREVLASIVRVGEAAQLSPNEFFDQMRSAAAILGRDPNQVNSPNARKLADLGLMGEYLDDLPYRSKILDIDQQTWSSWSIGQQQAFLDEINRKLRLYQIYHDDADRWVALDGGADPGEAVYPAPLDALP